MSGVGGGGLKRLLGPNYTVPPESRVNWQQVDRLESNGEENHGLISVQPNLEADHPDYIPRAAIFAAGASAIGDIYVSLRDYDGVSAVLLESGGFMYAAPLPRRLFGPVFANGPKDENTLLGGALLHDDHARYAGIGVLYPNGTAVIPAGVQLFQELVPVDVMATHYPDIPMVSIC